MNHQFLEKTERKIKGTTNKQDNKKKNETTAILIMRERESESVRG